MMVTPAVRIVSTIPGLWRAGVQHEAGPVEHPPGTFRDEELDRLFADPALIVDVLDGSAPADRARDAELAEIAAGVDPGQLRAFAALAPERREAILDPDYGLPPPRNHAGELAGAMPHFAEADLTKAGEPRISSIERVTGQPWTEQDRATAMKALPAIAEALRRLLYVGAPADAE